MLEQITDTNKIIGKTIKNVGYTFDEELIIIFTDESFICLYPTEGYDDEAIILCGKKLDIDNNIDISAIVDVGIITMPEYNEIMEEKRTKKAISTRKTEQQELARLKTKYEHES